MADSDARERDWQRYYTATANKPPRPLLVEAVELLPGPGAALDLGCGAGNDTRYLLEQGFHVTAVDAEPAAIEALAGLPSERLRPVLSSFADFAFGEYDLVSAQLSLPFNPRHSFADVFSRVKAALRPGGIFTGQFFGLNHEWNQPGSDITFHTRAEIERLLDGLDVIVLRETEEATPIVAGGTAHWHQFAVIARRPA